MVVMQMNKLHKVASVFGYVIFSIIITFALYAFISTELLKKDYVDVFGYTYFIVSTGSMRDELDVNDVVIVSLNDTYNEKDIITFREDNEYITHRIVCISGDTYTTKGDANNTNDNPIVKDQIVGKVVFHFSLFTLIKIVGVIIILFIIFSFLNFDKILTKVMQEDAKKNNSKKRLIKPSKLKLDILSGSKRKLELTFVGHVQKILALNHPEKRFSSSEIDKLKFLYALTLNLLSGSVSELNYTLDNPIFTEKYDYKFNDIGFSNSLRNRLYVMPITVYLEIMILSILYHREEFFDATYKVLKYKIMVDKDFNTLKNYNQDDLVNVNLAIQGFSKKLNVSLKEVEDYIDARRFLDSEMY